MNKLSKILVGILVVLVLAGIAVVLTNKTASKQPASTGDSARSVVGSDVLDLSGKNLNEVGPSIYNKNEHYRTGAVEQCSSKSTLTNGQNDQSYQSEAGS